MRKKKCTICKSNLEILNFNSNKSKKDGLQSHCKLCNRIRSKQYYSLNKEKHLLETRKRKKKVIRSNQQYVYDLLKNSNCVDCGENNPICLEFDHVRGTKYKAISEMIGTGCGRQKIDDEIAKCEIRCSNCHRKKTAVDQNWYCNIITN